MSIIICDDHQLVGSPGDTCPECDALFNFQTSAAPEQQPVAYQFQDREGVWHGFVDARHQKATIESGDWAIRALYTHADPSEVEQLRADVVRLQGGRDLLMGDLERRDTTVDTLRSQLEAATQRADAAERELVEAVAQLSAAYMVLDQANRNAGECQSCNERSEDGVITHDPDCIFCSIETTLSASAGPAECQECTECNGSRVMTKPEDDGVWRDQKCDQCDPAKGGDGKEHL